MRSILISIIQCLAAVLIPQELVSLSGWIILALTAHLQVSTQVSGVRQVLCQGLVASCTLDGILSQWLDTACQGLLSVHNIWEVTRYSHRAFPNQRRLYQHSRYKDSWDLGMQDSRILGRQDRQA